MPACWVPWSPRGAAAQRGFTAAGALLLALTAVPVPVAARQATTSVGREALALAYLRLDYLLRDHPLPAAVRPGFNRAFDSATLLFFGGQFDRAGAVIDSLAAALVPAAAPRQAATGEAAAALARLAGERLQIPLPDGDSLPFLLYLPPAAESRPVPLVVALHGAGGDERMFLAGYGAGRLLSLARERGFAVLAPLTTALMNRPDRWDALIAVAGTRGRIDPSRVYLLGHSLGAGAAWGLARQRSESIAAVACLAGACGSGGPGPPLLVVAAEVDPLAQPARLEAAATAARATGQSVGYRVAEGWGHTLMVGAVLDEVITWLLGHSRATGTR